MGIDSANALGIASSLVRICSPDVTSDERGLLPKQNGGNRGNTSTTPTHSGWLRDYRQDVNRIGNQLQGEAFQVRHPQFLKNIRGESSNLMSNLESEFLLGL